MIKREEVKKEEIRIKGLLRKRKESLNDFLDTFFKKWNNEKETIYIESHEVQTPPGKRRSLGDIYSIVSYYYGDTDKVFNDLLIYLYDDFFNKLGGRSSYCNQIKKRVWYYDPNKESALYNDSQKDEYGYTWNQVYNHIIGEDIDIDDDE